MATQQIDQAKAEAFGGEMVSLFNHAMLANMCSIGHQTGLFDTMSKLRPSTSQQIADATGLNERYVREWLGAVVTGKIVEYDPSQSTYYLPPEHAAFVTRAAGPDNLAFLACFLAQIGEVEQGIIECFRKGGGLSYDHYPRFQALQAELSARVNDAALIKGVVPLVPGMVDKLTQGARVLDVGCGCGHAINLMAQAFPNSQFVGYDFSQEGIATARAEANAWELTNARFEVKDLSTLNDASHYDLITAFDAIHDQAQPTEVLTRIARALKDDGVFLMVDIRASSRLEENLDHPLGPTFYTISTVHCMTVSLALNGEGLGTMWGEQLARQKLKETGFANVDVQQVVGDIMNNYYIAKKR